MMQDASIYAYRPRALTWPPLFRTQSDLNFAPDRPAAFAWGLVPTLKAFAEWYAPPSNSNPILPRAYLVAKVRTCLPCRLALSPPPLPLPSRASLPMPNRLVLHADRHGLGC